MKNIVLIGMPGAGKSTIGVVLAKIMQMDFCDTDLVIQKLTTRPLQDIIDNDGVEKFIETEECAITSLKLQNTVIATGGSVVLSPKAMAHLAKNSNIVYLKVSFSQINERINNIDTRGIAFTEGQTLRDIYDERIPLYEKYADVVIDCESGIDCIKVAEEIKEKIFHI